MRRMGWVAGMIAAAALAWNAHAAERTEVRALFDFEDVAEAALLKSHSQHAELDIVQDYGVTHGKNCLRVVGRPDAEWTTLELSGEQLKDWDKFEFFALDVYLERETPLTIVVELWDKDSVNYATRCTYETKRTHVGANRMLWRIDQSKRNNKEGAEWSEVDAKDKIDRAALSKVKIFFAPFRDGGDTVLWIDHLRLMQEDAVGGKLHVKLPPGAKAWDFGNPANTTPGFEPIGLEEGVKGVREAGVRSVKGVVGAGMTVTGRAWPDPLSGDGIASVGGDFTFQAPLPDGEYFVWISATRSIDPFTWSVPWLLKAGGVTLFEETLDERGFYGEKGLFRHLRTQYSQRPNALWFDYVDPEAATYTAKVKVSGGSLPVQVSNFRLAALIAVPANEEAAFKALCDDIREQRIKIFNNQNYVAPPVAPKKGANDGAYVLWVPRKNEEIRPSSSPDEAERAVKTLALAGAPGQRLAARVCVTAFEDLGRGELRIGDLAGPSAISAKNIRLYYQNYRVQDSVVDEMGLLPWTNIRFEKDLTWAYWLWVAIPADAAPGTYKGTLAFKPERGGAAELPVELEVYPFKLVENLPLSLGMYYKPWDYTPSTPPPGQNAEQWKQALALEQFKFMREIGFTAVTLPSPLLVEGDMRTRQIEWAWRAAKDAGFGKTPEQQQMTTTLTFGRRIGNELFYFDDEVLYGRRYVDRHPGIEFTRPELRWLYTQAIRQYRDWFGAFGMPVALEVIDEPRETPNPWNRRRDETIRYADWQKQAGGGFSNFVTFMSDRNADKDYTMVVDHIDIVATHATQNSAGLIRKAREARKPLWLYNNGMDRLSWGFYVWRMNAKGRWEWHFCFTDDAQKIEGFPNPHEWYTPFTGNNFLANHAPYYEVPGGFLFKSAYFNVMEGINDLAYMLTLEKAAEAAKGDAAKAQAAAEAAAFLEKIRASIPEFPGVKNLESSDAGALVGKGVAEPAGANLDAWRRQAAELLRRLAH
ncbi:MAG: hypothetical protein KIS92_02100 [Planctomycetota bacterium]|nr:hypothetical protein [Planctomycetota bacterium]